MYCLYISPCLCISPFETDFYYRLKKDSSLFHLLLYTPYEQCFCKKRIMCEIQAEICVTGATNQRAKVRKGLC